MDRVPVESESGGRLVSYRNLKSLPLIKPMLVRLYRKRMRRQLRCGCLYPCRYIDTLNTPSEIGYVSYAEQKLKTAHQALAWQGKPPITNTCCPSSDPNPLLLHLYGDVYACNNLFNIITVYNIVVKLGFYTHNFPFPSK